MGHCAPRAASLWTLTVQPLLRWWQSALRGFERRF